jgi:hypothetical protein
LVCFNVSVPSVFPGGVVAVGLEGTETVLPSAGVEAVVLVVGEEVTVLLTLAEAGTDNLGTEPVRVCALIVLLAELTVLVGLCLVVDGKNGLGSSAANTRGEWKKAIAAMAMLSIATCRTIIDR